MIKLSKGMLGAVCKVLTGYDTPVEEFAQLSELECTFTLHGGSTQPLFEYSGSLEQILIEHYCKTAFNGIYYVNVYGIVDKCNNTLVIEPIGVDTFRFKVRNNRIEQIV